jgi:hypothetical protein
VLRVVDVNGDGKPDIVVGGTSLDVFLNTSSVGTVSFGARSSVVAYQTIADLDATDIDGNGVNEIITVGGGSVDVYTVSAGVPSLHQSGAVGTAAYASAIEAFDIDGDGWGDLAIAESNGTVSFWVSLGTLSNPMFGSGPVFTVSGSAVSSIIRTKCRS